MAHKAYIIIFTVLFSSVFSQTTVSRKQFTHTKQATVNFSAINQDFNPTLLVREMPKPGSKKIEYYNYPETQNNLKKNQKIMKTILNKK
jgi:hypothetical protein